MKSIHMTITINWRFISGRQITGNGNVHNSMVAIVDNHCYVAVCNNYAICNTLQTALNCNAVCNTSHFKLRCEGNAICNVLHIASKFYHLKYWAGKKNWSTAKCRSSIISYYELNKVPIYSRSACKAPNQHYIWSEHYVILSPHFCERGGGPIRSSVYWFVCPSICHKKL